MLNQPKRIFKYVSIGMLLYLLLSNIVSLFIDSVYATMILGAALTFPLLHFWLLPKTMGQVHLRLTERLRFGQIFYAFVLALGGNFLLSILLSIVSQLLPNVLYGPSFAVSYSMLDNVLLFLCLVVVAPLFEEYLFRGFCLMSLRRYGNWFAIFISSLLFAFMHGNLLQGAGAFFIGLVLGYLAVRTDSIAYPILFHSINNLLSFLLLLDQPIWFTAILLVVILSCAIAAIVLFILEVRRRKVYQTQLIRPYDFKVHCFFNNWASITLLVILLVQLLLVLLLPYAAAMLY